MANPLHTRLCDDFGIEFPVMAFSHCKDVVAAVTNAGGIGILGTARKAPEQAELDIKWLKQKLGNKPFGVDVLIPASMPPTGDNESLRKQIPSEYWAFINKIKKEFNIPDPKAWREGKASGEGFGASLVTQETARKHIDLALEYRVPILASALGNPAFVLKEAHQRGLKVFSLVGSVRQAVRVAEAGVDYVVAQGT
ncbi:MAG: nitronate monooxygenase, partial [Chloroflexi bacterium]|nr:nitronate monooxygenase [Chloroflexota bacterium]